ncbi:MAG: hypothetical protein KTR16_07005 [Acidiferrobacterales bacterium]|nr:hypothetical protein [Acidiferrobacterales bacterium]
MRRNRILLSVSALMLSVTLLPSWSANANTDTNASLNTNKRFEALKQTIFEQAYEQRPTYKVTRKAFGAPGNKADNHLRKAARRTLDNNRDLLEFENGQKLLQANGICFTARWQIDETSEFTGLFSLGTRSPAIVRASVALSGVLRKNKRAFGIAVKLLPDDLGSQASLNLFALNSMGGVVADHTLGLSMSNQPPLGGLPKFSDIRTALRMKKDLEAADREQLEAKNPKSKLKPKATFRPINHLAEYNTEQAVAPKWIRFNAITEQRVDQDDFRDELALENYENHQIIYGIEVAKDHGGKVGSAEWQRLGRLVLMESITSKACDAQLHFQHPSLSD